MSEAKVPALTHQTPDCRGRFEEVRSRVKVGTKRRTVRHYTCTVCKVTVADDVPGAYAEFWEQQMFAMRMEQSARDAKTERTAAAAIASAIRTHVPSISADEADAIADACIDALRPAYVKIVDDTEALQKRERVWQDVLRPAVKAVQQRIVDALPELHSDIETAPNHWRSRTPRLRAGIDEAGGHAVLVYLAPADAPAEVLNRLEFELPSALPPIKGVSVTVEIRRAS